MPETKHIVNHLVITFGFSKRNALEVIKMFYNNQLTTMEEEVIKTLELMKDGNENYPSGWFLQAENSACRVLEHLNYKIIQTLGYENLTKLRRRR